MTQTPQTGDFLLRWRGDSLSVALDVGPGRKGRAALRTNIGHAKVRRREIIAETERGETPMARAWTDIPLAETAPGVFRAEIPLDEVGVFSGKACFFPEGSNVPEWPEGANFHVKVESAETRRANSIYTVFPRQFGSFREVARRLPLIMDSMGFRIIQTLPPFPVPTTYAVMGEYGCPFAALDFMSVDPAMAEFDETATPLDQFKELIDAVHARRGLFLVDLPANHTGWASTLQTHHPDWFRREAGGRFVSPGAWGVTWADLVELDYTNNPALRAYMADVFLFWCRNGVDGFRCDAGYMIPAKTWEYVVARVREEYPDTVFMLEGLGGELKTTDALLAEANLDWAYSEIFQTYDRGAFEWYLPGAIARSERYGTLVHFAETHDNDRLAKGGETYARLRVRLAALLSWQGAWGIANGVEWFATEKIDVHGKSDLNWGAKDNMVEDIARLNHVLATHPSFSGGKHLEVATRGDGNTLAVVREGGVLVVANLDCGRHADVDWDRQKFPAKEAFDLLTERKVDASGPIRLAPGEVMCLAAKPIGRARCPQRADGHDGRAACPQAAERRVGRAACPQAAERCVGRAACPQAAERRVEGNAPYQRRVEGNAPYQRRVEGNAPYHSFHCVYPRDARRDVVVPEGELVEVSAPHHFRCRIVDPATGKTLRVQRSQPRPGGGYAVVFDAPHYKGDGTRCRELALAMVVYESPKAVRTSSRFLVPPRGADARVKTALTGAEIRRDETARTILSNGAGAAAQIRLGWGRIASQYDAFLAANPNPACPSDRVNLWARTRVWLQREGYTREFDAHSTTSFRADPAGRFARWDFIVPCGMGKSTAFTFEAALADGANAARLSVTRRDAGADDVRDQIRLVFRPDVEWRSFHATTKAYAGLDELFPKSAEPTADGFAFHPYGDGAFSMSVAGGEYHHEPQWTYNVAHPEEADRGQDPCGDLFSPGWISADLKIGETVTLTGVYGASGGMRFASASDDAPAALPFAEALDKALDLFIVKRDDLKTVIAGYPWFLDWGRDTFIFMRGMIAAGRIDDSVKILKAFAAFEENGTLPNIIYGTTAGNRDTTDAQLWFIRCVEEIGRARCPQRAAHGDEASSLVASAGATWQDASSSCSRQDLNALKQTCERIVDAYIAGTPNGIRVDPASGLVWSPSHFTWMDTNYPACTPRAGYPVEIQALWISALEYLGRRELAAKAKESVVRLFRKPSGGYCDCLDAPNGESADAARRDEAVRPNQLFLLTLGVLDDPSILADAEELLVPGGVRSLGADDPRYKDVYFGDEDTRRKPAYHNGTVWAWPFPLYAEAMAALDPSKRGTALSLLAGAVENLNAGCVCHMSEIADGDSPHSQKGCTAQAWSVSELLRVWLKLGGK